MSRHLWVVELWSCGEWLPTIASALTRDDARDDLRLWRKAHRDHKFRGPVKYVPEGEPKYKRTGGAIQSI